MIKHAFFQIVILSYIFLPCAQKETQAQLPVPDYVLHPRSVKTGQASWYSENDPGINPRTANNEIFDDKTFTAAMWDIPFHQQVKVTNLANGKSVIVRVNDRGPNHRYVRQGRIIDLTKSAFAALAPLKEGLISIQLEFL